MIYDRPKWRTIQGNTAEYRMGGGRITVLSEAGA